MNLDEFALSYRNKYNVTKDIESLSEMVDRRYKIVDNAELPKCAFPTRNSSYEKDVRFIGDRRVNTGDWMEHSNRLLDVGESEDYDGSIMNDYEGKSISDRTDKLDSESKLPGLIFMCNRQTMEDCFSYSLFGLPFNRWGLVKKIVPGTVLFLFEYEERKMWGIYEATSYGELNIEASAYKNSKGSFPAQVRIKEIEKCPPLKENEFKEAIIDNYWSDVKFNFALSHDQVHRLMLLFLRKPEGWYMRNLDQEMACVGFFPDEVKDIGDWIQRSDELDDFETTEVEKRSSIEINRRSIQHSYEPQLHRSMLDYGTARQPQTSLTKYHHDLLSDRSGEGLLSVKDVHASCSGKENHLLLKKKVSEISKGVSSDRPPNVVTEKTWNGIHLNASQLPFSPLNSEVYFLNGYNTEAASISHSRYMPMMDIYHTNGYAPSASSEMVDTSQQTWEQRNGKSKKILRDGLEIASHKRSVEMCHRDEVKHKLSVWYRLSSGVKASSVSPRTLNTGKVLKTPSTTSPCAQVKPEKLVTCEGNDLDRTDTSNSVLECIVHDEPEVEYPINFKRRKQVTNASTSEETQSAQEKKRRKLIRPDLMDLSKATDVWGDDSGSLENEKPQIAKQFASKQRMEITTNIVQGEGSTKNITRSNSSAIHLQPLNLSMESSSLRVGPSKKKDNLGLQNISVCKEQDIHVATNLESNNRSSGVMSEKGSCSGFEIAAPMEREATPYGDIVKTQLGYLEESSVSNCPIVINENAEKQSYGRDSSKVFHKFSILCNGDKPVGSGEVADNNGGVGLLDLNHPFCPEHEDDSLRCFTGGIDKNVDVIICNDNDNSWNVQSLPCLHLELTMVPGSLLSIYSDELDHGQTSRQNYSVSQ